MAGPDDDIPFGDYDDFELPSVKAAQSSEEAAVGGSQEIPVGPCIVRVVGLSEAPKPHVQGCDLNGERCQYECFNLAVTLENVTNTDQKIRMYLHTPPDPEHPDYKEHIAAYFDGFNLNQDGKPIKMKGMQSKVYLNFLAAMGYTWPKGGSAPEESRSPKNWKGRCFMLNIEPPYSKKEGKRSYNQIALMSLKPLDGDGAEQLRKARVAAGLKEGEPSLPDAPKPPSVPAESLNEYSDV